MLGVFSAFALGHVDGNVQRAFGRFPFGASASTTESSFPFWRQPTADIEWMARRNRGDARPARA